MICYNVSMNIQNHIQLLGFPDIIFAHTFSAESYQNNLDFPDLAHIMLEITYISEGELTIVLPDGAQVTACERSVICNPYAEPLRVMAKARHEHRTVGCRVPFRFCTPEPCNAPMPNGKRSIETLCLPFLTTALPENNPILPLIDEIILTHTMHTKGALYCAGLVLQLLARLDGMTHAAGDLPAHHQQRYVKKAKQYIFEHLREPIRQTDIAAHLGISPEYLCNVFKKSEGMPIIYFANRIKLEQIRQLIKNNGITLAEAAELYGFSDPNYVSRLHKKYFGYNITEAKDSPVRA